MNKLYSTFRQEVANICPDVSLAELEKAYKMAEEAHKGQVRYSGEPYVEHSVEVARRLLQFCPDAAAIAAALLHDLPENTATGLKEIKAAFGAEVAGLVDGVTKLSLVKVGKTDPEAEKWRKMFLALSKDLRIVFIKLADRLHNMQTLDAVPEEKRGRIARETLLVFSGVAGRLGIYAVKSELEDLAFRHLYPVEYGKLSKMLADFSEEKYIAAAKENLELILKRAGIEFKEVQGRMKHKFSIFQKMEKKGETGEAGLHSIYDLFAMRIILPDSFAGGEEKADEQVAHLYSVLGILHHHFLPLQDRFKDYIAVPKPNGYRSLHTTLLGLGGKVYDEPTEVQIRTYSMHREAEMGVASHWSYKIGGSVREAKTKENEKSIQKKLAYFKGFSSGKLSNDLEAYADMVFVLTPKGNVVELPLGATPIDFAYSVHTEVGNKAIGARINGKIVPLEYKLKNGEMVEIITRHDGKPSRFWLSTVKTAGARNKIRAYFKEGEEEATEKAEAPEVKAVQAIRKKKSTAVLADGDAQKSTKKVLVEGEENLPVTLSACCKPVYPCPIIGYITRGQSIKVHRLSCRELGGLDGMRFVSAVWKKSGGKA
ncbi:MAG: RelA/SpoT family protein [Candidatus Gracilibacteria bacterium]